MPSDLGPRRGTVRAARRIPQPPASCTFRLITALELVAPECQALLLLTTWVEVMTPGRDLKIKMRTACRAAGLPPRGPVARTWVRVRVCPGILEPRRVHRRCLGVGTRTWGRERTCLAHTAMWQAWDQDLGAASWFPRLWDEGRGGRRALPSAGTLCNEGLNQASISSGVALAGRSLEVRPRRDLGEPGALTLGAS